MPSPAAPVLLPVAGCAACPFYRDGPHFDAPGHCAQLMRLFVATPAQGGQELHAADCELPSVGELMSGSPAPDQCPLRVAPVLVVFDEAPGLYDKYFHHSTF